MKCNTKIEEWKYEPKGLLGYLYRKYLKKEFQTRLSDFAQLLRK